MKKSEFALISNTHARGLKRQEARQFKESLRIDMALVKTKKRRANYRNYLKWLRKAYADGLIERTVYSAGTSREATHHLVYAPHVRAIVLICVYMRKDTECYDVLRFEDHAIERMIQRTKCETSTEIVKELFNGGILQEIMDKVRGPGGHQGGGYPGATTAKVNLKIGAGIFATDCYGTPLMKTFLRTKR